MTDQSNIRSIRCMRCEAPIPFRPGAGSRLCPFCGTINLSREQEIAVLPIELKIDDIFRTYQLGQLKSALEQAETMLRSTLDNYRLSFYRASILLEMGRSEDAIFALIDLGGMDGPSTLRADGQAKLAEALLAAQRVEEAQQAAERCLGLMDGHPPGSYMLARALMDTGDLAQARQIVRDSIERLDRAWRITFPPRPYTFRLLLARIAEKQQDHEACIATVLEMLLTNHAAPVEAVTQAVRILGLELLTVPERRRAAENLLEQAAMLDPENRLRVLDALRLACEANHGEMNTVLNRFKDSRAELLHEIQMALVADDEAGIQPEQLAPEMDLTLVHSDADLRCDRLERAALRLNLPRFDRGTLYPLRTIEDFRRWVGAWRLRMRLQTLKQAWAQGERAKEVRQALQVVSDNTRRADTPRNPIRKARRPWTHWVIGLLSLGIAAMLGFLILAGNRYLDRFEGRLLKIECSEDSTQCRLMVATGQAGRLRHKQVKLSKAAPEHWWNHWKHGHVGPDGVLQYRLDFFWGDLDPGLFRSCVGRPIAKLPLTLTPLCGDLDRESSER